MCDGALTCERVFVFVGRSPEGFGLEPGVESNWEILDEEQIAILHPFRNPLHVI